MKYRLLTFCLAVFALVQTGAAQKRWNEIQFPPLRKFTTPQPIVYKMANGIKVFMLEDHELPTIQISAKIRAGSVMEPTDKVGLASITGTVMRSGGTTKMEGDALDQFLEDRAATMGAYFEDDQGGAYMSILKKDLNDVLPVFVDLLQNPAFPEAKLNLAKNQAKTSISRRNDNAQNIAFREFAKVIYGADSPLARQQEYSHLNNIGVEDLKNFHKTYVVPSNLTISVIGDFNPAQMRAALQRAFGTWKGSGGKLVSPTVKPDFKQEIYFANKSDVNQSVVLLGHIGGLLNSPDEAAMQVMNDILSNGFSGRMMNNIRTKKGLAYGVGGEYSSGYVTPGLFNAFVMTKSASTAEAINAILAEVKRFQTELVTEAELRDAKDRILNSLVFTVDSRAQILNRRITYDYYNYPPNFLQQLTEKIKSVTAQDIMAAAKKNLRPDAMKIMVVGNKAELGDQLNKLGTVKELDITIPKAATTKPAHETGAVNDANKGAEWMSKAKKALLGETALKAVEFAGAQARSTPMGKMSFDTKVLMTYPEGKTKVELTTPMGAIAMGYDGKEAWVNVPGRGIQAIPEAQMKDNMSSDMLWLVGSTAVKATFLGEAEMEGKKCAKLKLETPAGEKTLFLAADTALPHVFLTLNPQDNSEVKQVFSDYRAVNGIQVAHKMVSFNASGEEESSMEIKTVSINPVVDDKTFVKPSN